MRRRYFVHPSFQISFIVSLVVGLLLVLVLVGGTGIGTLIYVSHIPYVTPDQKQFLFSKARELFAILGFVAGILSGCLALFGLYFSFKLTGPLNRIEIWLEKLLRGQTPPPLLVRPKDELREMTSLLNEIREKMEGVRKV